MENNQQLQAGFFFVFFFSYFCPFFSFLENVWWWRFISYSRIMAFCKGKNLSYGLTTFVSQCIKKPQDVLRWTSFFIKFYDDIYHDVALKRVIVQKRVLRLLESLALPVEQQTEKKLIALCQKIYAIKAEFKKERNR